MANATMKIRITDECVRAVVDVLMERVRQVDEEGWTPEHDDQHVNGEMAKAAACYAMHGAEHVKPAVPLLWPWSAYWWKPTPDDREKELIKAGALIVAELGRLRRAKRKDGGRADG